MADVMPLRSEAIDRRTTSDYVVDALREAILAGRFADGEELNQVSLARHFGVSRVPVREALRQLQAEGLIDARPHQQVVVRGLTRARILEILDIRTFLEGYLMERALERMTSAVIDRLEASCDAWDEATDRAGALAANQAFHETLYQVAGADVAFDLHNQLATRVDRYLLMAPRPPGVAEHDPNLEHRRITEALRVGDHAGALVELRAHVAHRRAQVLEFLDAPGSTS